MKFTFFLILIILLTSCTVIIPDIKITGEKTALENQVMGEYAKIKEDAWMIASERGSGQINITADRKDVVEAVRDREFNKDDINEMKIKSIFGENQKGLLEVVDQKEIDKLDKILKDNALIVFEKENKARVLIMQRIIETDIKYNSAPDEVYESFFNMNLSESPDKTFYKNKKGEWLRK
ncbi:MAG: DUF1318 domain-containing protein [Candidatus Delongbacteria bacterium]|nr:DUF1318 domain-containing protein [Candidatus Delongbacteria bacterium]